MANKPMDKSGAYSANIDTFHKTTTQAVMVKAGFMDISDADHAEFAVPRGAGPTWQPSTVQIRMHDGRVLPVHHETALQRVLQGVATLV